MKCHIQSVSVYTPRSPLPSTTMERRPMPPRELERKLAIHPVSIIRKSDGAMITWRQDGRVMVCKAGGEWTKDFPPKPTMANAVEYSSRRSATGGYFKFSKDGSIHANCFETNHYWGPDLSSSEWKREVGTELDSIEIAPGQWVFSIPILRGKCR